MEAPEQLDLEFLSETHVDQNDYNFNLISPEKMSSSLFDVPAIPDSIFSLKKWANRLDLKRILILPELINL